MIHGEKVILRGIKKSDAPFIYEWVNQEELRDLTGTLYPISEYEHERWIESVTVNPDNKLFAICFEDKCIGTIGLKNFDHVNRNAELFISIGAEEAKNCGGGADAVKTLVDYCFMHLNIHRIYLHVFESNKRAIRCYEKAGFIIEGRLKDHHFAKGKYEDVLVMGRVSSS